MAAVRRTSRFFRFLRRLKQHLFGVGQPSKADAPPLPSNELTPELRNPAIAQFVHDLKNQLTILLSHAENVGLVVVTGEADEEIAELRRAAERSLALTQNLLLAAQRRSTARRAIDLNEIVRATVETLAPLTADRISVRLQLPPVPVRIAAEPFELERILLNLALNACDAMADEGVLTIETAVVHGRLSGEGEGPRRGPYARLTVTDTGPGMSPEIKNRIFDPFFTTKEKGTGLGLSSVAHTVRQLQGTIFVESQRGQGTSVIVILPLTTETDPGN
jgi:signal transduction histidine kinase